MVLHLRNMKENKCVMGCHMGIGQVKHSFPKDPKRRAEWCRILGIYPRTKKVHICSEHFSNCYILGNRLSKYAIPNPPKSRKLNSRIMLNSTYETLNQINENVNSCTNSIVDDDSSTDTAEEDSYIMFPKEINAKCQEKSEENLQNNDIPFLGENKDKLHLTTENLGKVEDFEIRKSSTNDTIIKGRYVQTNDYLVVTYTPPRKWTLQQQVEKLDTICERQLRYIKYLNRENSRLQIELKKHITLLPKLRELQTKNRYLMSKLKIYKQKEVELKKSRRARRLKEREVVIKEQESNVET